MSKSSTSAAEIRYLPTAVEHHVAPIPLQHQARQVVPIERFAQVVPTKPTRREKQLGKELVVRALVMEGHFRLQQVAAVAITRMHDHTHEQICTGIIDMNARVRSIVDPDDQAELAAITAEQKHMFVRQQFALLEAGAYRVAAEVDRELYAPPARGLRGLLLGD